MKKHILFIISIAAFSFSATTHSTPVDDDVKNTTEGLVSLYLMGALPEACAQVYPDLRNPVEKMREDWGRQISGHATVKPSETTLPKEVKEEIAACIHKPSALSKKQCSRLIEYAHKGLVFNQEERESENFTPNEAEAKEIDAILKGGRQMLPKCTAKTEKDLQKSLRK